MDTLVVDNGHARLVPLMNAGSSSSTLGRSSGTDPNAQRFCTSQITAAEMSNPSTATGQRGNTGKLSNLGDSARKQYLIKHRSSSRYSQLAAADQSDKSKWSQSHQFQERPSSSHRKDEVVGDKEPAGVNGTRKNRIQYSGPLMPPGVNMEEILKEHERQIQQAVRRARLDKGKGKHAERDQSEWLLYAAQRVDLQGEEMEQSYSGLRRRSLSRWPSVFSYP
ncbi:chondroitinase-AC-like [Hordeum vulgare subsp. vulgare]|uniref:chondroitinase-AC-like n=1 Tax=Hordeum vulgare subsp. vulgare TaxID=112509 RepID=UPI001D1A4E7D|nr:chondroitinase-AC-like [Hordeum vulgare subsp. vulgare]XP_044950249.1 chondroitinase-AC-like [Hordeum vulgare subsp. vulgare]XP_044950250.1 chondroitinase-AC-like [Hordeum vulgare subsp. vulgare]XP_044950251.1 chondroitinase-AC-like [Hordeum vulgare subsp. vulgare]XP_044950252.1 chondroitinase-AC-like [Hordeum vulgare subsp. vulgare]XP_044950253.1 chondroitinase-AC-like [Hordeum vulgare subsp. vulgare]